jgi:outer membrane protein assembly factor BamB
VQVNGVVWSQVVVGNTVYAGGQFTSARPAGAAPGVNTTVRSNLLAYTLSNGVLVSTFAPTFDQQVLAVAASPDGSRVYVGGQFTHVNGGTRNQLVALDPATGAVIGEFAVNLAGPVKAIVATKDTVYVAGSSPWQMAGRAIGWRRSTPPMAP